MTEVFARDHSHVFLGEGHARNERRTWMVIALCTFMMVAEIAGVRYYDDSKGTNVGAVVTALEGLAEAKAVLIAGGRATRSAPIQSSTILTAGGL